MSQPTSPALPRRRFLRKLAWAGGIVATGFAYTRWVEPTWLQTTQHDVPLSGGHTTEPIRLLHLSDFHASAAVPLEFIQRAVETGLRWEPDLVVVTGDFITWRFEETERYSRVLAPLAKAAPTFACLGNHDGGVWAARSRGYADSTLVRAVIAGAGVILLHNANQAVALQGRKLHLVGVGDLWAQEFQPTPAFGGVNARPGEATLLLAHNPDTKDRVADRPWDLMLSGHTHGGQLRLPLIGEPFAPVRDKRFVSGLHRWEGRWLHVTKGVGNLHGLRFNCRPEVCLLTLS